MKNLSFSAMISFPRSAYFTITAAMEGIAIFNTTSADGDTCTADISFDGTSIAGIITAITENQGSVIRIAPTEGKFTAPVKSYVKPATTTAVKRHPFIQAGNDTKIKQMEKLLQTKWFSVKQLEKATGWKSSTIHARFTALRKRKLLSAKNGPNDRMVYHMKTVA